MLNKNSSKKSSDYFTDNDLQYLFSKIIVINRLNQALMTLLPSSLRNYCQVANLINQKLVLIVANGSVATQIRYQTHEILAQLKQNKLFANVKTLECKVSPDFAAKHKKQTHTKAAMAPLTPKTAAYIRDTAESIEDPKLKEIMLRIASRQIS